MGPLLWSICMLGAALVVIGIEIFVPSAGLLGFLAGALLLSAIVLAFFHSAVAGVLMILGIAMLMPFIFIGFVKIWPSTPIGRRILIRRRSREETLPDGDAYDGLEALVGRTGLARTPMLPSGQIVIDESRYDAVSQGMPIEAGDRVRVIDIRTYKIIVRRVDENEPEDTLEVDPDDLMSRPVDEFLAD